MAFLKFIFIIFFVVWLLGLILRATFSRFLRKRAEEFDRAAKNARREAERTSRKRDGEVTIQATDASAAKKVSRRAGDYVEFEEIKEKK